MYYNKKDFISTKNNAYFKKKKKKYRRTIVQKKKSISLFFVKDKTFYDIQDIYVF